MTKRTDADSFEMIGFLADLFIALAQLDQQALRGRHAQTMRLLAEGRADRDALSAVLALPELRPPLPIAVGVCAKVLPSLGGLKSEVRFHEALTIAFNTRL